MGRVNARKTMLDKPNEYLASLFFTQEFGLKLLFFLQDLCAHSPSVKYIIYHSVSELYK